MRKALSDGERDDTNKRRVNVATLPESTESSGFLPRQVVSSCLLRNRLTRNPAGTAYAVLAGKGLVKRHRHDSVV